MNCTRRQFLKVAAAGTTLSFFQPSLFAAPASPGRVLVVLFLNGGNDAVNTVIPYADSRYRTLRPTLAVPEAEIVMLDDRNGFHPALAPLQPFFATRRLALINGVGFSTLDRSHFHCRDIWMTADLGEGTHHSGGGRGWLGRYADLYLPEGSSPLTTIAIGRQGSLALDAESVLPATVPSAEGFGIVADPRSDADDFESALRAVYADATRFGDLDMIRRQGLDTFGAIDLVKALPPPAATVTYPETALGRAFSLAAQIIDGDVGTHAIWINHGGFDTHSNQPDEHATLLGDVAESLAAFHGDLAARAISDRAVVMAWSEFGRRAQENASRGTDHGKAGTVMVLGDAVNGGSVYGGSWDLARLDDGDLPTGVDFRAVYSTLIRDWYGNDPMPVLGAEFENLGFIRSVQRKRRAVR